MDRLQAFFMALEYLNICECSQAAGPLKYLSELEEWRHENRGLAVLLAADTMIRNKLDHDKRKDFPTLGAAMLEVLTNREQLWNDARSSAELEKFRQAEHKPSTPSRKRARWASPITPPKEPSAQQKKNKARREKQKALLKQA